MPIELAKPIAALFLRQTGAAAKLLPGASPKTA